MSNRSQPNIHRRIAPSLLLATMTLSGCNSQHSVPLNDDPVEVTGGTVHVLAPSVLSDREDVVITVDKEDAQFLFRCLQNAQVRPLVNTVVLWEPRTTLTFHFGKQTDLAVKADEWLRYWATTPGKGWSYEIPETAKDRIVRLAAAKERPSASQTDVH